MLCCNFALRCGNVQRKSVCTNVQECSWKHSFFTREESNRRMKKLFNQELNTLYSSRDVIRMITWRRMTLAGYVARVELISNVYVLTEKPVEEVCE